MDFRQIRYFLALAETLNFTRAAERCHVTQPTLTQAIKRLEDEVGGPLLIRDGKATRLTTLGRTLKKHFAEVEQASSDLLQEARKITSGSVAHITIGVAESIGPQSIAAFVGEFRQAHPRVTVSLRIIGASDAESALLSGDVEVCFTCARDVKSTRIDLRELYQEPLVVVFPPEHRFAEFESVKPGDLRSETIVAHRGCAIYAQLRASVEDGDLDTVELGSAGRDWVQTMVEQGLGVSVVPAFGPTAAALPSKPLGAAFRDRTIAAASVYGGPKSRELRAFLDAARTFDWDVEEAPGARAIAVHPFPSRAIPPAHQGAANVA